MSTLRTTAWPRSGQPAESFAERWQTIGSATVVAGSILRLLFAVIHPAYNYIYSDMAGYVNGAKELVEGAPLTPWDGLIQPGTHLLIAAPLWLFGTGRPGLVAASWMWWVLSSLIPLATWQLARRLVGLRAAVLATALAALDPLLISYGGFFTSELPATALLLCALALAYRARPHGRGLAWLALAGLLGGAAVVIRPQLGLNLVVFAFALRPWMVNRRALAVFACALALPVAGGIWYSSAARGQFTLIASNDGMNFFLTECPVRELHGSLPNEGTWGFGSPVAYQLQRGSDYVYPGVAPWDEGFFYEQGFHCLTHRPLRSLVFALRNVADLTVTSVPWPQSNEVGLGRDIDVANVLYCGALLLTLLGIAWWKRRTRRLLPYGVKVLLSQLLLIVPLALLFGGEPRYRIPYDPFGLILIATAAVAVADRLKRGGVRQAARSSLDLQLGEGEHGGRSEIA